MSGRHATLPDVLVLGAGGALAQAWLEGVLGGLEDASGLDLRRCEVLIGTSAGAVVAARLAAGHAPPRPAAGVDTPAPEPIDEAEDPSSSLAAALLRGLRRGAGPAEVLAGPIVAASMQLGTSPSALVRAGMLARIPRQTATLDDLRAAVAASGARFDGRLRVVAVDRRRGRRVVFGAPGGPSASVADAVAASCSSPWLHAPAVIDEREYVGGALWSPTNLDLAPGGRDTRVLCLAPAGTTTAEDTLSKAARLAGRSATELEWLTLRHRGQTVCIIAPDRAAAAAMDDGLGAREQADRSLAAGHRQGTELARRSS